METGEYPQVYGEALARWARLQGDAVALRFGDEAVDYAALDERATRIANGLAAMGLRKGDRVAYLGKNSAISVELVFGTARAGMVLVPIIWRLGPAEVGFILEDCEASLLAVEPGFADIAWDGPRLPMDGSFAAWRDAQPDAQVATPVAPADTVILLYTSGTTGLPKGVMLTHANGTSLPPLLRDSGIYWYAAKPGDVVVHAMPYGHIAGVGAALNTINGGGEVIVHAEFDPALMLHDIEHSGAEWLFLVPAALAMLLAHPAAAATDFSKLVGVTYGASPIPLDLLKQAVARMDCEFAQLYGLTETWGTVVTLPPADHLPGREDKMRAAGLPLPGVELRILGEHSEELPPGETGEIAVRSPTNMKGYWNRPGETAKVLSPDGWLLTGDAGMVDADGYLFIQDRIKDMIITGGENVYPAQVESALYAHPDIADVAVIGVPDEKWGEAVKAVVVRRPGSNLDEAGVIAFARAQLAGFKCPKSVDFIDMLPRNPSGKILRRALRAPYWEGKARQVN